MQDAGAELEARGVGGRRGTRGRSVEAGGRRGAEALMRTLVALGLLVLAGCARGRCAQEAPVDRAAVTPGASARLVREPAPGAVRKTGERIVFHDVRLDDQGLLLPALDVDAPFAEVPRLGFRAFVAMPDAANGKKPYFSASMFTPTPEGR